MKLEALNYNTRYLRAYKKGRQSVGVYTVVYVLKNRYSHVRIGITATKKLGKATKRNRAKRLIRAAVSAIPLNENAGYDIIIVARSRILTAKSYEIVPEICARLCEAGVIANV